MKHPILLFLFITGSLYNHAQKVTGYVIEETDAKKHYIPGALVSVLNTSNKVVTNELGQFTIDANPDTDTLIVSSLGFQTDTIALNSHANITITLRPYMLEGVEISSGKATKIEITPMNVEVITSADLVKDACCNLSESFENSATVDVSFSDAVSGAKQIRMLGLDGTYTQIMVENMPSIRSLGNTFGMNYIPGPVMNSIQINKGAGSVVNGYEGMTGQINVELKKPQNTERLFVNLFLNQDMRTELNIISATKINSKWSTLTSAHGQYNWLKMDMNKDHYLDNALIKNLNLLHRVTYNRTDGGMVMLAVVVNLEDRHGGSSQYNPSKDFMLQNAWGLRLQNNRIETFAKTGFNLKNSDYLGIQYKYIYHHQYGNIGRRSYAGLEHFGYLNLIYQRDISEKDDMIKVGVSFQTDYVKEAYDTFNLKRTEVVPGIFGETSLNFGTDKKVMLVSGIRLDYHNLYGALASPRFNLKWNILYDFSLRVSAGRGYRVPTIFAEHFGLLSNNRSISVDRNIKMEEAWNYGASLHYKFFLGFREGNITVDFYRTDFTNQVVVDLEDPRLLQFYNLNGNSFANAVQIEAGYEVLKGFDVKLAYKYEQTKVDYNSGRKIIPLRPQHRGLLSLQYTTKNRHWRFNSSLNWFGKTRIPDTSINNENNQRGTISKDYVQLNAQITFSIKKWEFYIGGENITNFIQANPIISGEEPFSEQFDASLIWGPLRGAMVFTGVRFTLK